MVMCVDMYTSTICFLLRSTQPKETPNSLRFCFDPESGICISVLTSSLVMITIPGFVYEGKRINQSEASQELIDQTLANKNLASF